ncbi:Protein of uncharacterised function (DUF423) [Oligella urethralis]|uniref:DUF423 domain-containing protein n=1 Tax=Oligella urethralis TaxID=90245 RepID=UPI000DFD3E52|nr:DUF423 domain-containing protein [Oligella urethralis]SUA66671.1 Protein of uncharacterised function (DUF423) [Oligella urethralis]
MRLFIIIGAIFGFLGVALGAFGAHGLKQIVGTEQLAVWQTGVQYQMYHSLALLSVPLLALSLVHPGIARWAGWAFVLGVLLFSGSLYAIVLLGVKTLGLITPIGGLFFLAGWLLLLVATIKK